MKSLNKILSFLIVAISFLIGTQSIYSQINIQRVVINPLNRTTIYCSELPQNYATKLSDDKQKVVLMLRDALVTDSSREKHSTGIISDVYVQSFKKNLEVSVILKDKRGYTAAPLIYSRAVMVEVFKWDQLTPAEDEYKTALLALEANIVSSAEQSLEKAVSMGNADASVFLGFIRLQQGNVKSALENLLISYKFQIKIPDAFAALSQIMKMSGYQRESAILADSFYKQTGLTSFPEIVVPDNPELTDADKNYDSLLKEFSLLLTRDSSAILAKLDSIKKDSTDNKRFKKIFDTKENENSKKDAITQILESFLPEGFSKILFVFIVLFVVIFVVLIFAYLKWRKKQVEQRRKKPSDKRKDYSASKPSTAIARKAASAYQKSGNLIDKKIGNTDELTKVSPALKTEDNKSGEFKQTFEDKLNELAEKLDPAKKDILLTERGKLQDSSEDVRLNAKLELALHLLDEQQKLKDSGKSVDSSIQTDISKLKEVARSLGISKEINQPNETKVDESKEMISQLADKFAKEIDKKD